jgi:hypothetical protein
MASQEEEEKTPGFLGHPIFSREDKKPPWSFFSLLTMSACLVQVRCSVDWGTKYAPSTEYLTVSAVSVAELATIQAYRGDVFGVRTGSEAPPLTHNEFQIQVLCRDETLIAAWAKAMGGAAAVSSNPKEDLVQALLFSDAYAHCDALLQAQAESPEWYVRENRLYDIRDSKDMAGAKQMLEELERAR